MSIPSDLNQFTNSKLKKSSNFSIAAHSCFTHIPGDLLIGPLSWPGNRGKNCPVIPALEIKPNQDRNYLHSFIANNADPIGSPKVVLSTAFADFQSTRPALGSPIDHSAEFGTTSTACSFWIWRCTFHIRRYFQRSFSSQMLQLCL